MSYLKDCPFCGSSNIDVSFARGFEGGDEKKPNIGAGCMDCGACAPMVLNPKNQTGYKESAEAWNKQVVVQTLQEKKSEITAQFSEYVQEAELKLQKAEERVRALESIINNDPDIVKRLEAHNQVLRERVRELEGFVDSTQNSMDKIKEILNTK